MKARLEKIKNVDGSITEVIKTYPDKPRKFAHDNGVVIGGGQALTDAELKAYGFLNIDIPSYDELTQELTNLHLDGDIYTYDVIEKPIKESLSQLKNIKISELKSKASFELSKTDWYVIREADSGEATPQSIKDERATIRTKSNEIEAEINALSTKKAVVTFPITL